MLEIIKETVDFLKQRTQNFTPEVGIVLGSGLGNLASQIIEAYSISYQDIPNFPVSTVKGHKGKLVFGTFSGKKVVAMQGRFHFYEGYSMKELTFPIQAIVSESEDNWLIKRGDKVLIKALPHIVDMYGVIASIRFNGEKYEFPLCDLEVIDKALPDFQLIDDYKIWFANR